MKIKKTKNIILILSTLVLFLSWCSNDNENMITETWSINTWTIIIESTWSIILSEEEKKEINKKEKIANLRKKLALRWLIRAGDINLQNKEYTSALVKYLKILKEIPNDENTIKKLWDVYFEMKKFKNAYLYYSRIKEYNKLDKDRVIQTLFSFNKIEENNFAYLWGELKSLSLDKDRLFYYSNSLLCKKDLSLCKLKFQEYFDKKNENEISLIGITSETFANSTWSVDKQEKFEDLYNIEKALTVYKNSQIDDLYYKWALVAWAYFENWLYPIAIEVSKTLLKEKSDYKPLLKLVAKSYFELWNFVEAKLYLIEYNKLVKNDPESSYFLWVVYAKLHEYLLSNIHLKKALMIWHKDVLDINKMLLINYYEEWKIDKMLETMRRINKNHSEELTENDFWLYIYYHIINEKIDYAKEINEIALENFPESAVLNWYYWWILMDNINKKTSSIDFEEMKKEENINEKEEEEKSNKENIETEEKNIYAEAEKYINKWLEIDTNSPMLNLVRWKLEISKWNYSQAFIYFKKTIAIDNNWDFWKIAEVELENIQINKD